jgi:rhodanese-related sulfurtransferase
MVATISPAILAERRARGEALAVIDVRTPAEFGEVHVAGAQNMPLDRLDPSAVAALGSGAVYVVCKSGGRSRQACEKLLAAGLSNAVSIEGGTAACEAAGLPVVRGRKAMSLERQVRIAAGSLVAIGAALAAFGPPAPIDFRLIGAGLAGFVGCGLVFAGVTDTCGMAMLLARMPWNQAGAGAACARAVLLALALAGTALAGHTKDSLDSVRTAVAGNTAVMLDVREPDEWEEGHVAGAGLLPLSALERGARPEEVARVLPKDKIIYCYCLAGGRCLEAAAILAPLGYDVRPLAAGYPELIKAGFPVARGK